MVTTKVTAPLVTSIGTGNKYYNTNSTVSPSINTAYNIVAPKIQSIPSPQVFYSYPENKVQIASQVKQANTVTSKAGSLGSTTVIPTTVLKSSMDKISNSGIKTSVPLIYPTPAAQGGQSPSYTPPPGSPTQVMPDYDVLPKPDPGQPNLIERTIIKTESRLDTVTNTITNTANDLFLGVSKALPWIVGGTLAFILLSRRD